MLDVANGPTYFSFKKSKNPYFDKIRKKWKHPQKKLFFCFLLNQVFLSFETR
jgi:hypothetical protein